MTVLWVKRLKIHIRKCNHHHHTEKPAYNLIKAHVFDQNILIWGTIDAEGER